MLNDFKPDGSSLLPLYAQLADYIRTKILKGTIKSDTKLPGRSTLINMLGVGKNTILSAFGLLIQEGLLESRPKSGFYVTNSIYTGKPDWMAYIKRSKHRPGMKEFYRWADRDGLTDFGLSSDFDMSPYVDEAFRMALPKMKEKRYREEYSKYGLRSLREAIVEHVGKAGIKAEVDNILIGQGNIQIQYLFYESIMSSGSNFLHEKAHLMQTTSNIHSLGVNMIPVVIDKYGISTKDLERHMLSCKSPVLHINPTDQAPTGAVMNKKRMADIMRIVRRFRAPVVEIDILRDAWCDRPFPPSLKSMDEQGQIIYQGGFVRGHPFDFHITWFVADSYIIEHVSNVFVQNGSQVNYLFQLAAAEMFNNGIYAHMMEAARAFIRQRRAKALELCNTYLQNKAEWDENNCGFHFWIKLTDTKVRKKFDINKHRNFYPGYFFDITDTEHVLFCPSSIPDASIEETVRQIAEMAS